MKIGLASENKLPKTYSSKTHDDGERVTLEAPDGAKIEIATNSFQSVANILAAFAPDAAPTLEPGTTFYIRDGFSDRETSVTANALADVASALRAFAVKSGKYIPSMPESEEAPSASSKTQEVASQAIKNETPTPLALTPQKRSKPEATAEAKADRPSPEAPAAATADTSHPEKQPGKRGRKKAETSPPAAATAPVSAVPETMPKRRGRPPKVKETVGTLAAPAPATPIAKSVPTPVPTELNTSLLQGAVTAKHTKAALPGDVPAFMKTLKAYYIIGDGEEFRFDYTPLEMDGSKRRVVVGPANNASGNIGYGYEVKTAGDEHVGWIIVEDETRFIMTGLPQMDVSSHRNIEGCITKTSIAIANKIASLRAKAAAA